MEDQQDNLFVADESTNEQGGNESQQVNLEPFDDGLYNANNVAPVGTPHPATEQPQANPEEQRFEYWQSKYDQKASDFNKAQEKLQELERVAPIAEHIEKNPWILDNVARSVSGDSPQVPSEDKSVASLKKPIRPDKPSNYDISEAHMDSESQSYKYQRNLDEYRDDMVQYQETIMDQQRQEYQTQQQAVMQQQQKEMARQSQNAMQNNLVNSYGYTPEKAQEFVSYYQSPESITLDNLVALDRLRKAPSSAEVETRQKAEMMKNRNGRLTVPPPAGVTSGQSEPNFTDEDMFNLALMNSKK